MDDFNLMEFNSPILPARALSPILTDGPNISPGNNPFDSLSKQVESLYNSASITHSEIPSNNFQTSPNFDDFFKLDADIQNCGRQSLAYLRDFDLSGRESLGILKLDTLNFSFNNDNLSVPTICTPTFNNLENQKSRNFSNSPLNTAFLHPLSYCNGKQSILSSSSSVSTDPSLFNSGSLEASEPSKIYSLRSTKNFDLTSTSEDALNNAFLCTYVSKLKLSDSSTNTFEIGAQSLNENFKEIKQRLLSLPELKSVEIKAEKEFCQSENIGKLDVQSERSYCSESEIGHVLLRDDAAGSCVTDVRNIDETFNDSVFIEANHLASKIADGSILVDQSFGENGLDNTSPPSFEDIEECGANDVKVDAETLFKVIDKMLPPQQNHPSISKVDEKNANDNSVHSRNGQFSIVDNVNVNVSPLCQSYSSSNSIQTECKLSPTDIYNTKSMNHPYKYSISRGSSSSSSKSRDANELLQDLSEIINHSKQKAEGQQLLFSLANILCSSESNASSNKYDNLEDSGHSSIEHDEQQNDQDLHTCYEVLDLRVAASKSNDTEQVLDLSMKSKVQSANKRRSQSFSFPRATLPPTKLFDGLKVQSTIKSSTSSLDSSKDKFNHDAGKLKPKKVEEKIGAAKKGPLKAVIPLGNMSKRKSFSKLQSTNVTPPKTEQAQSTLFKVKRTSTPIAEPHLKPVAQSTPDGSKPNMDRNKPISCSSQLKKRKFYCPVSPLARPSSIGDSSTDMNKSSYSGSTPNLSSKSGNPKTNSRGDSSIPPPKPMHRRHSATELKVTENSTLKLKRSYSIGKDLKTPGMIGKMKESVCATLSHMSSKGSNTSLSKILPVSSKKNSVLQERNSGIASNIKRVSLLGRLKKNSAVGKENVGN